MNAGQLQSRELIRKGTLYHTVSKKYIVFKRIFDTAASFLGIILLFPLVVLIAAAIRLDSPGPVFFEQERCGLNGRVFKLYKFRSMVKDAHRLQEELKARNQVKGHMFKLRDDPRVTRVGRFIRRTGIDELPQLWNVLKGDMSLVGPRPPIVKETAGYAPWHNLRMSVKPGITGLWQVKCRNTVGFEEMVRLDLKYIRERSFWYDLKIILKTIPLIFGDSRAS